jgi:hypothetical protein
VILVKALRKITMQKTQIALFPLQLFLLPNEVSALHIFEERYQQLLEDCENMHIGFGIPFAENGYLTGVGCMVKIKRIVKRYPNGTADIEVESTGIFKIEEYYNRLGEKMYPGGEVIMLDSTDFPKISKDLYKAIDDFILKTNTAVPEELFNTGLNCFDVGRLLNLTDPEKIALVNKKSHAAQEKMLMNKIKLLDKLLDQKKSVVGEIFLN